MLTWPVVRNAIGYAMALGEYRTRCLVEANCPLYAIDDCDFSDADLMRAQKFLDEYSDVRDLPTAKMHWTPAEWSSAIEITLGGESRVIEFVRRIEAALAAAGFYEIDSREHDYVN